jgi:hypothetical protein
MSPELGFDSRIVGTSSYDDVAGADVVAIS